MQIKYTGIIMIMLYLKFNIGKKSGIRHDNLSKRTSLKKIYLEKQNKYFLWYLIVTINLTDSESPTR